MISLFINYHADFFKIWVIREQIVKSIHTYASSYINFLHACFTFFRMMKFVVSAVVAQDHLILTTHGLVVMAVQLGTTRIAYVLQIEFLYHYQYKTTLTGSAWNANRTLLIGLIPHFTLHRTTHYIFPPYAPGFYSPLFTICSTPLNANKS